MRVIICGPNLNDQSKGGFHVHAEGCADLKRNVRREPMYEHAMKDGAVDAPDRVYVAEYIYDNGIMEEDETGADYLFDFHFFACCDALPVKAES